MLEIGFWELVLLAVIVLIVAGPERLPGIARAVGRWAGRARALGRGLKAEFDREMQDMELRQRREENPRRTDGDEQR